jgi:hypothetical protein
MALQTRNSSLSIAGSERVEFSLDEFKKAINSHGYYARWSKASICPNKDPNQDDHHIINCSFCDKNGFIYYDPIDIRVHVTSFGEKQLFMPESRYDVGTAYFTTLPEYKLSFWDKIELTTAQARFTQVLKVQGISYKLKYPALTIDHVITNRNVIVPNSEIAIQTDGTITFGSTIPGTYFSICFLYHPTYIMVDLLHQIRDSRNTVLTIDKELEYPSQAVGKLDFLVRDESED